MVRFYWILCLVALCFSVPASEVAAQTPDEMMAGSLLRAAIRQGAVVDATGLNSLFTECRKTQTEEQYIPPAPFLCALRQMNIKAEYRIDGTWQKLQSLNGVTSLISPIRKNRWYSFLSEKGDVFLLKENEPLKMDKPFPFWEGEWITLAKPGKSGELGKDAGIEFKGSLTVDFGEVPEKKILEKTIVYKNVGEATLFVVLPKKVPVGLNLKQVPGGACLPGATGALILSLDTSKNAGIFSSRLDLTTNAPDNPYPALVVKAVIKLAPFTFNPAEVSWGEVKAGETRQQVVNFTAYADAPFTKFEARSVSPAIIVNPTTAQPLPTQSVSLSIILDTRNMNPGEIKESVQVKTNFAGMEEINIPVTATVK